MAYNNGLLVWSHDNILLLQHFKNYLNRLVLDAKNEISPKIDKDLSPPYRSGSDSSVNR